MILDPSPFFFNKGSARRLWCIIGVYTQCTVSVHGSCIAKYARDALDAWPRGRGHSTPALPRGEEGTLFPVHSQPPTLSHRFIQTSLIKTRGFRAQPAQGPRSLWLSFTTSNPERYSSTLLGKGRGWRGSVHSVR